MRRFYFLPLLLIATLIAVVVFATAALGAETHHAQAEAEHHALPLKPDILFEIGPLEVTNSMVVTWVVALGIIVCAQLATRRITPVPQGLQNFWEWMVARLYTLIEGLIGGDMVKQIFW